MLRRLSRSVVSAGLRWSGADRAVSHATGLAQGPLILGYHRVLPDRLTTPRGVPSLGISTSTFEQHLAFVGRRYRFVSLDEMGQRVEAGTAGGLAAVTFDDGYADFFENAFPILQRLGVPAGVFVVTDLVENAGAFLHDRLFEALDHSLSQMDADDVRAFLVSKDFDIDYLPRHAFAATRLLLHALDHEALLRLCKVLDERFGRVGLSPRSMTWDELGTLARAGITIGSHTRTHTLLTRESPERVALETRASKREIEARLNVPVRHFVYPDGCFDKASVRAVAEAGYRYAYTGCRHRDDDFPLLTLPRRVLWEGSTRGAFGALSLDVLSSQIHGVFDLAQRCFERHGETSRENALRPEVAVVGPSLDVIGGQSIQADALISGLRADGFSVRFVPTNPRFPKVLRWARRVPLLRTILNQAIYLTSLRELRRVDVVHAFSASYLSFLLAPVPAMVAARLFGKRVVLNYHSGEADDHLQNWGLLVHPWLRLAHDVVVPSAYLQAIFARHGSATRVIRNVVDTSRFVFQERTPLRPRLLSTRNLEPGYRVDVVLEAFAELRKERPDATLVIAGTGSEEARLRHRAQGVGGVTFVGRVEPKRMPELCGQSDIFLNASVVDNQPLSLLESFAAGLPVVTTPTGGITEMVKDGRSGLIVPPLDASAMAAAVLELLRNDAVALRVAQGGLLVARLHTWAGVRDEWAAVYAASKDHAAHETAGAGSRIAVALRAALIAIGSTLGKES